MQFSDVANDKGLSCFFYFKIVCSAYDRANIQYVIILLKVKYMLIYCFVFCIGFFKNISLLLMY